MFFRQLLNDETACASYLLGCKPRTGSSRSWTRTSTWSTTTSRSPRRRASRSSPCSRRTCRPTTSPGCRRSSQRTGATRVPAGRRRRRVRPSRARRRRGRQSSATPRSRRSRRPGHALAHHAYLVTDHRARRRAVAGADRRRAAGRRRRAARPARPRRADRRGDGARALPLADRAAADAPRPPPALPGALLGLGLRPRAVRPTRSRRSASSAATTRRSSSTPRTTFVEALVRDIPPAPAAAGRDRRRQPLRPAARRRARDRTRSGSGCARTSRSSRCWSPSTPSSARWSASSARPCRSSAARTSALDLERRGAVVHRRLRARQGAHQPRRRRARRARSAAGGC